MQWGRTDRTFARHSLVITSGTNRQSGTMGITDFFAGEIAVELLKMLVKISRKSCCCKSSAERLIVSIEELIPTIQEIKYSGVELPALRQSQLERISETLIQGKELAGKIINSSRWNVYKNLQLARKMEKLEKAVSRFVKGPMQTHILADVHHLRFETAERFDRLEGSARRLEQQVGSMKIGVSGGGGCGWWVEEAFRRAEEEERWESGSMNLKVGLEAGKRKVKEMVIGRRDGLGVLEIFGPAGSGKTTLAREFCRDIEVRSYFNERILFLTVSQSPNVEQLRARIWGFVMGIDGFYESDRIPQWPLQHEWRSLTQTLVVLDDVWSLSVLEQLILRVPGCKTLVVSRFKFPSVFSATYQVELLGKEEALSLFCHAAFGQESIPLTADEKLVNQVVNECKGLPLALKVIGASLREQSEMFWVSAKNRLSRGEPICESHENKLLQRMALSIEYLPAKVGECFLDLGSFPEDKKIPLNILINMWVEIHDIDEEEAFAILVELSDKNLLTLVKDVRSGDVYSSYYDIFVKQHDVLRDLALYLSSKMPVNDRIRLLMPRREAELPKEWLRNSDQPFHAQIVSVHTGAMKEKDWTKMQFPRAEILIFNFSATEYFLPPFIDTMPMLKAIIIINYNSSIATLHSTSVLAGVAQLRSLWLEKVSVTKSSHHIVPLKDLQKINLVLCQINNILDDSTMDVPRLFPQLSELTIDHCDDLTELPPSICEMQLLNTLSITNCHSLHRLPADLGKVRSLQILRLYACPALKTLPPAICELPWLKFLDISQCINLISLPEEIGKMVSLEKIDMRECLQIRRLPDSVVYLQSLCRVVCDEEVSWLWKDVEGAMPDLHVLVSEKSFDLDWLDE